VNNQIKQNSTYFCKSTGDWETGPPRPPSTAIGIIRVALPLVLLVLPAWLGDRTRWPWAG